MSSGNDGAFQNICWLFEDAAGVHGGDGTATSACWIQPGDAGVCAGIGADPSTVCSSLTGTWAAHISDTGYDADLVCLQEVTTGVFDGHLRPLMAEAGLEVARSEGS